MKISIIIPVRYRHDLVEVCLDSLFKYTKDFELVIVQDGKDDVMAELIHKYNAKFVYHEESKGYVKAINAGFKEISVDSDYVMFLNSDTCCTPGWMNEMLKCFDLDPQVGLVAPTCTAWNADCPGMQSVEQNPIYGEYNFADEVAGVCMLYKREAINTLIAKSEEQKVVGDGILDERYDLGGGDDIDICMRIKLSDYKTVVSRKSFIYHYISASFRKLFNDDVDYSKKYSSSMLTKFQEKWKKELGGKPHVFIAIPTSSGNINHALAIRLIEWSHDPEITVSIRFYSGLAPLDNARNVAVKAFLEDYYTHMLQIDDDIVPPQGCLRELLVADKEIIAPLCFTTRQDDTGQMYPYPVAHRYNKKGEYEPYHGSGIEETDVVTGGMFLVKREVYEKLERPFYFTYHKNGTVIHSEDFIFSQQAQELGYKLYTHYGLHCGHLKQVDIKAINDLMCKYGGK
jgi:GT2 family glycosyltransferase